MKNIVLVVSLLILSMNLSIAQNATTCGCLDIMIKMGTDIMEKGMSEEEAEKKYAKQAEGCEELFENMGDEAAMEMMACPNWGKFMELMMKIEEGVDGDYLEE
tara:strand:- start:240 stop:548 length:309 start_codon:yes stop_codon:yes gene_type:complete